MQSISNNNYWEIFRQIPTSQRSKYLQRVLELPQLNDYLQIPKYQYPQDQYVEANGMKHHVYIWPKTKYVGVLFLMHGLDGHGGASGTLAKYINEKTDYIVISLDFRNSGKSIFDDHGYIQSVNVLIKDAEAVVDAVLKRYCPKKLFLGGVSMGGGVAYRMALNRPFLYNGIIMFAPALRGNYQNGPFMKKLGKILGTICPKWKFIDNSSGSGNRHSCFNDTKDPLNYNGKLIPGSIKSILEFMQQNQTLLDKIEIPYLMLMGASDKIVDPFLAVDLDSRCKSKDKTTYIVKDMWHYIPLQPQYMTQIIPLVIKWLNDRSI